MSSSARFETATPYYEYKYLVPRARIPEVQRALEHYLTAPALYAVGRTVSHYYDSDNLGQYELGLSGSSAREKLRYRVLESPDGSKSYCVELKAKSNLSVFKKRVRLNEDISDRLDRLDQALLEMDEKSGARFIGSSRSSILGLKPTLKIEYTRKRYICPISNARVNFDTDLQSTSTLRGRYYSGSAHCVAPFAILEVKAPEEAHLPAFLNFLKLRRTSFSKYCYFMSQHLGDDRYLA